MNPEKNIEVSKIKAFPEDFPRPVDFSKEVGENSLEQREARKIGIEDYDEQCLFFADGSIDEEWITNFWYIVSTHSLHVENKPEKIEIQNFGQFLSNRIPFSEYFSQSSAFNQMMNRPDEDSKRSEIIDYMDDFVMRTLGSELSSKIDSVHGLREKITKYLRAELERSAYFMREKDKWAKKIDNPKEESEELKQFMGMTEKANTMQKEIIEILTKNKLW